MDPNRDPKRPLGRLLGAAWAALGRLLGASWGLLGASWVHRGSQELPKSPQELPKSPQEVIFVGFGSQNEAKIEPKVEPKSMQNPFQTLATLSDLTAIFLRPSCKGSRSIASLSVARLTGLKATPSFHRPLWVAALRRASPGGPKRLLRDP